METTNNSTSNRAIDNGILEPILFVRMPLSKKAVKSVFKLNPESDRYRICPNCKTGHMVSHRTQDFCSKGCCDEYNNLKKKLQKQSEEMLTRPDTIVQEVKPTVLETNPITPKVEIKPEPIAAPPLQLTDFEKNIQLLNRLKIDLKDGTCYLIQDLLKNGFNFFALTKVEKLYNIPASKEAFCKIFGKYRMYLLNNEKVLIAKES